jgi:nicotinamide riboside transporter PnuC
MTTTAAITVVLTTLSLLGTVLVTKQDRRGFIVWIIANIGWSIIDYQAAQYAQAVMFAVYLGLAVWGYVRWQPPQNPVDTKTRRKHRTARRLAQIELDQA